MAKTNRICSVPNCDKAARAKGLCGNHRRRQHLYGDVLSGRTPAGEPLRFIEEVAVKYESNDCLSWPFGTNGTGYGILSARGKRYLAHRYLCMIIHGEAPTSRHEAAHSCGKGNEGCVNPNHLSWKTPSENQADRISHGTHDRGERQWRSKLTERDVREIRRLQGVKPQKDIAAQFGVSVPTVSEIQSRRKWAWLPD